MTPQVRNHGCRTSHYKFSADQFFQSVISHGNTHALNEAGGLKPMKKRNTFRLLLVSAWSVLAVFLAEGHAQAGERTVKAYTTDRGKGGLLTAKISWTPNGHGAYKGRIQGKYEDRQADGYCIQGFKTGGQKRIPLGATACPKGQSIDFNDAFNHVAKAAVEICRVNNINPSARKLQRMEVAVNCPSNSRRYLRHETQ